MSTLPRVYQGDEEMAKLLLTVKGELGRITLDSFLTVLNNSFGILKDLDSAISLQPKGSLDWIITDLHVGSLAVEVGTKPKDPSKDYGSRVTETYVDGLDVIDREGITPPYFSDRSLELLEKSAKVLSGDGAEAIEVTDPARGKSAKISAQIAPTVKQLMGTKYQSFGSVEGTLEMISIHKPPRFNIYHTITLHAVRCNLPDKLRKTVADALGRRVIASGEITYNAKDEPRSLVLEELEVIPLEDELPTIEEFIGSDPDFTGDMTTKEYIQSIRNA